MTCVTPDQPHDEKENMVLLSEPACLSYSSSYLGTNPTGQHLLPAWISASWLHMILSLVLHNSFLGYWPLQTRWSDPNGQTQILSLAHVFLLLTPTLQTKCSLAPWYIPPTNRWKRRELFTSPVSGVPLLMLRWKTWAQVFCVNGWSDLNHKSQKSSDVSLRTACLFHLGDLWHTCSAGA